MLRLLMIGNVTLIFMQCLRAAGVNEKLESNQIKEQENN